jgi:hypothetical protein
MGTSSTGDSEVSFEFLSSLIQLSDIPEDEWIGKTVYHPMGGQMGDIPIWRFNEMSDVCKQIEREFEDPNFPIEPYKVIYDVGVVHRVTDGDPPPYNFGKEVFFGTDGPEGFCLHYNPDNLWIEIGN